MADKPDFWKKLPVLVTGGASFIGSHLVDALVERGAAVHVIDDLSTGKIANIERHLGTGAAHLTQADVREARVMDDVTRGKCVLFHLAARHGGRYVVDHKQVRSSENLAIDSSVFQAALAHRIPKIVFASSACVYPVGLQNGDRSRLPLVETQVGPPFDPDNLYGHAKLLGELTLARLFDEYEVSSVSLRFFTVYGPRALEDHSVMAMIARAFLRKSPFEVWGDGTQVRSWTYVGDIVRGILMAAELPSGCLSINLGAVEPWSVERLAREVLFVSGHEAPLKFLTEMPTGPRHRIPDIHRAGVELGWKPEVPLREGLLQTVRWYNTVKRPDSLERELGRLLIGGVR